MHDPDKSADGKRKFVSAINSSGLAVAHLCTVVRKAQVSPVVLFKTDPSSRGSRRSAIKASSSPPLGFGMPFQLGTAETTPLRGTSRASRDFEGVKPWFRPDSGHRRSGGASWRAPGHRQHPHLSNGRINALVCMINSFALAGPFCERMKLPPLGEIGCWVAVASGTEATWWAGRWGCSIRWGRSVGTYFAPRWARF
jgi:hypothetical protein